MILFSGQKINATLTGFSFQVACGVWQSGGRAGEIWTVVNGKWHQVVCLSLLGVWMVSWHVPKWGRKKKCQYMVEEIQYHNLSHNFFATTVMWQSEMMNLCVNDRQSLILCHIGVVVKSCEIVCDSRTTPYEKQFFLQ